MATTKINVCVDENTKQQAERLLNDMGLTMTAAINMFLSVLLWKKQSHLR
jgi:addiction module RelB/DinJ family antitoxin